MKRAVIIAAIALLVALLVRVSVDWLIDVEYPTPEAAEAAAHEYKEQVEATGVDAFVLRCTGDSMFPQIRDGDYVVVERIPFAEVETDGIAVFRAGDQLTSHRVTWRDAGRLITQGDNNPRPDPGYVTEDRYHGLVRVDPFRPLGGTDRKPPRVSAFSP